ncbi:hypothetical protein DS2_18598 [Catenovulum agarivorans DS-2]|uniref:DUF86 domain-containing protein n=1 Tax=Catenovulum agarivorans DS-2 TaxID=1328313 RepID=W7QS06_9ALTE|nr:DUF86 domain-containing protein [Catenovulum agarivorans]EWH08180.1 hypothetical protein DS2_18598 [Catenovulum agarivorans DS-2]
MDNEVVLNKLESLRRCLNRIQSKTPESYELLANDYDLQDIIVLNLERAIQTCVDIALHIISTQEINVPDTMSKAFFALTNAGLLNQETAERMAKAVGFRNTAVHAYQELDWQIIYSIITLRLDDFKAFAKQMYDLMEQQQPDKP